MHKWNWIQPHCVTSMQLNKKMSGYEREFCICNRVESNEIIQQWLRLRIIFVSMAVSWKEVFFCLCPVWSRSCLFWMTLICHRLNIVETDLTDEINTKSAINSVAKINQWEDIVFFNVFLIRSSIGYEDIFEEKQQEIVTNLARKTRKRGINSIFPN